MKNVYRKRAALLSVLLVLALGHQALAAGEGAKLADSYLKKQPAPAPDPAPTLEQAMKIQAEFIAAITPAFGKVVGYKAGLTNPSVQKVFGVTAPVRGTLLEKMILKSGTTIEAAFGARPLYEGDLILRVGSEAVNSAKTPMEALAGIDAAIPFIELPDLVYAGDVKINGALLAAVNVAARYGIVGDPIPVQASAEWMERLKTFKCQIYDEKGTMLIEAPGSSLLDHPINVVLWIRDSLKADGIALKKGDLLSLGTITKLTPTAPNTAVKARYVGLDPKGPAEISVTFK
ncbi:MAG: 2-oxopent-4-enoate hydratase [Syntrophaceae bacterium PtaB.Bin038]|nr:MAG: 2-oxopent-4-enoate hydratase [Syntrophaceae bacterium PtaB.Bin038]